MLYMPDPICGYYRGTRFDWSGVVAALECAGHNYFGPWFERHDPMVHDAITGPVEEFQTNGAGLGYAEADAGGAFVRIGVGVVRKPEESAYRQFGTYEILDPGRWKCHHGRTDLEFVHELDGGSGYEYIYRKNVRLLDGRAILVLEHSLKNTGCRPIETTQYNHNFFVIDGLPSGPDFVVEFPFEVQALGDLKGLAEIRGRQLVYLQELRKGQSILTPLAGFGETAADYDITISNRRTGAGVRIKSDQPISKLVFWSIRTTLCPEPYVTFQLDPDREACWAIAYQFYTLTDG